MSNTDSRVDVTCVQCSKPFKLKPSQLRKRPEPTCSKSCCATRRHARRHISVACVKCGAMTEYAPGHLKRIQNPTCSAACETERLRESAKSLAARRVKVDRDTAFWNRRCASYQRRARVKGWEFDLTPEWLKEKYQQQRGVCSYSGLALKLHGPRDFDTISLDRVNPDRGYTKDNVLFCIDAINMMKSDHRLDEVIRIFMAVSKNLINFGAA